MNWINDYVKPRIQSLVGKRDTPDNLWVKCEECSKMIFRRDFEEALHVCDGCGRHHAISPLKRFHSFYDNGKFTILPYPTPPQDPLKFKDSKRYSDRLKEARAKTGETESVAAASGLVCGVPVVSVAHDFAFMGGSMGVAVGNAMLTAAQRAVQEKAAMIVFPASGGARMQEGALSLMQMPRTTVAADMVHEAKLPFIVVLTNPTTGGVTASYAMLGDIHIAEPGALICFTGPRVIEQTIRETLPPGFQRSEYLLEHGMTDMIVPRGQMRETIGQILRILMKKD